ncbi:hypothetical protein [Methylosinus sp. RM1]|uniref:hypothetical protein n=1 Tax=Methylosinus sp. RM1 TaxID=2583817 RepID=UPI00140819FF|nr:hypothetical protein [Methylosinus sp. RM1]
MSKPSLSWGGANLDQLRTSGGKLMTEAEARAKGYAIPRPPRAQAAGASSRQSATFEPSEANIAPSTFYDRIENARAAAEFERERYADAIMSLPEAKSRPRAAKKIAEVHNAKSLPPHKASALLASLPAEISGNITTTSIREHGKPKMTNAELRRLVEVRLAGMSASRMTTPEKAEEARRLSYALRILNSDPRADAFDVFQKTGCDMVALLGSGNKNASTSRGSIAAEEIEAPTREQRRAEIAKAASITNKANGFRSNMAGKRNSFAI